MNPGVTLVFGVLFGCAGYGEANRFQKRYGRSPFGWPAIVWGVVCFLSFLIGIVLLAIAERIGRSAAATTGMNGMYTQPVYAGPGFGPPGYGPPPPGAPGYGPPAYAPPAIGQPADAPPAYAPPPQQPPAYAPPPQGAPPQPAPHLNGDILPK